MTEPGDRVGSGGLAPQPAATHVVAVYRPSDGRVLHLHQVVVLEGGKDVGADVAERGALESAERAGLAVAELSTLRVTEPLPPEPGMLRVDLESECIVSEPPDPGKQRSST